MALVSAATFEQVAATADFGEASARKAGRNPRYPYVPVILVGAGQHQRQIFNRAFASRAEAVSFAEAHIEQARRHLAERLADPRNRLLREQYGLPREISR